MMNELFAQPCRICRTRDTLDQEGNCTCCPFCGESKTKGRCSGGMTCQLSTEIEMPENPSTASMSTNMQEPPDINVLKDCSRLNHYIMALKRWSDEGKKKIIDWLNNKYVMNEQADVVKAFNQFFNITRVKNENPIDYITRFEKSYAEVKKTGENLSSIFRAKTSQSNKCRPPDHHSEPRVQFNLLKCKNALRKM